MEEYIKSMTKRESDAFTVGVLAASSPQAAEAFAARILAEREGREEKKATKSTAKKSKKVKKSE